MSVIDVLKEIILDFQTQTLETGVPRRLRIEPVPGKAAVCLGVRRGGKSTFLFQVVQALYAHGVKPQNMLYVNFFDDRLHELTHHGPAPVLEAYFSLFPEKKDSRTTVRPRFSKRISRCFRRRKGRKQSIVSSMKSRW